MGTQSTPSFEQLLSEIVNKDVAETVDTKVRQALEEILPPMFDKFLLSIQQIQHDQSQQNYDINDLKVFNQSQAAKIVGVTPTTLKNWRDRGKNLRFEIKQDGTPVYLGKDLKAYCKRLKVNTRH